MDMFKKLEQNHCPLTKLDINYRNATPSETSKTSII